MALSKKKNILTLVRTIGIAVVSTVTIGIENAAVVSFIV